MARLLLLSALVALTLAACDDTPADEADAAVPQWAAPAEGPDLSTGTLMSVWGPSADRLFAVGGQPDLGTLWRADGDTWRPLAVPAGPLLNWVHGAAGVTWIVGDGGRALRSTDGETFAEVPTDTEQPLWGVWAADADTAWAVGGDARAGQADWAPVILRWDGARFVAVPLPDTDRGFSALFKVWGSGPDDVVAVGARGVVLAWDGAAWRQQTVEGGTADDLISVWGRDRDRVLIAGGRANALVLERVGDGWRRIAPDTFAARPGLNGVWVDPEGVATLVGLRGAAFSLDLDGAVTRARTDTSLVLHAVFGAAARRVAVGGSLDSNPPWTGVIVEQGR